MRYFNYPPMYYNSFWPGGLISLLINVLFWALIISLVLFLVRKMSWGPHHFGMHDHGYDDTPRSKTPYLDILKERYAKGEIDKKQFEEMKKDLN